MNHLTKSQPIIFLANGNPSSRLFADLRYIRNDRTYLIFFLLLMMKSFLFIGIANNENASSFSFLRAFYSFQAPPSVIVYAAFLTAFSCFAYLLKEHMRFCFLYFFNGLVTVLMVGDLMYFRGFGSFLSPYVLSQFSNLDNLSGSIISMLRPIDVLFFLDLIVLFLLRVRFFSIYQERKRRISAFFMLFILSFSALYLQHYRLDIQRLGDDMLFRVAWVANQTMTNLSPLGYHAYDVYKHFKDNQAVELNASELQDIQQWFAGKIETRPDNRFKGLFKGKNLIMIQVESLENFVVSQKINGQEITPVINSLLKNSLYFPNLYEQVYNGNSSDADFMINTSVYPVRKGATFFRFPGNTYNSLPKLLENNGYTTLAIHPDKGSYWNWMQALDSIGFNKTLDASNFNQDEIIGLGLSDGSLFSQVAPILAKEKEPFYAFMVTLTSHSPFDLPEKYQKLHVEPSFNNSKLGGYFQSIHYTDQEIGHFLEKIEESQLLDNTVVVIYGDHTGVHKYYNAEVQQLEPSEEWWLDDSKRIPLLICSKDFLGEEINVTGGQIDIMPTLAYLFDLDESYQKTSFGRNLLNTNQSFAVLADGSFIGTAANDSEKELFIKGLDISDLIIRSNFYQRMGL